MANLRAPHLQGFQAKHPGIELDLTIDEALTDIIVQGFHAGIRLGDHLQDNMITVRLSASEEALLVASPDYLRHHGVPEKPGDLLSHTCIRHRGISSGRIVPWQFNTPEGITSVDVSGGLIFNDLRTVIDAARLGYGIAWSLRRGVCGDLERGALVEVLPRFVPARPGFHLFFPKALRNFTLLRAFIEHFRMR